MHRVPKERRWDYSAMVSCQGCLVHNQVLCASVCVPIDSVPTTQSLKRVVGTIVLWPQARACWVRVEKRDEERVGFWLVDGVEVSVMACFINSCQCQPMCPSLVIGGQSCVYHSQCVVASSISLMMLACFEKWGHWASCSESGMALVMMPMQSSHLTHAW